MKIVLVGKRGEERIIRWSRVVGLSLVLAAIVGIGMAVGYRALSGVWQLKPALLGIVFGALVVGVGTLNGLKTPLSKLRTVK